ncbi:hypothetical protein RQP46_008011 [Phenoliferia psychrophenolica]
MSTIALKIKHAGKSYDLTVDTAASALAFKEQIFQLTGVDVAKVKVVVKGGMLKDDADLKKVGLKPGQTIMVIGAAGPLPEAPTKPIVFMEDMSDQQLAEAVRYPVGLQNLGNTCYMNSTIQVLRAIPELQTALNEYKNDNAASQTDAVLVTSLRDLYRDMGKTSEGLPPVVFLNHLRQFAPQFAERSRATGGYSQQDAQEVWGSIITAVKNNLATGQGEAGKFVQQYMTGEMVKTLKSVEAPDEPATVSKESFGDIKCNISSTTNYMINGIVEGLEQEIEKNSPSLGRSAVYHETTRISRLPSYLTVNLVRFFWRREINKKTKIMRKVKFPFDLDVLDLITDDLKKQVLPLNEKLKEVDKDRRERSKVRRRAKVAKQEAIDEARGQENDRKAGIERDPALMADAMAAAAKAREDAAKAKAGTAMDTDAPAPAPEASTSAEAMVLDEPTTAVTLDGELVDEPTQRATEATLLRSLVNEDLAKDVGANYTGMYELVAIVTHKGASADGGHYVGWHRVDRTTTVGDVEDPDKEEWYRFDDDKVSTVRRDKITSLDGGGEDHSAYILLYASKKLE